MPQFVSVLGAAAASIGGGLRRSLADNPAAAPASDPFTAARGYHRLLRSYYANDVYGNVALWHAYRASYKLPRSIRSIYNPTRRAVDSWPGRVYPGAMTEDGRPLPDGTPSAVPFTSDVLTRSPDLVLAAVQALEWGNWGSERSVYVREGNKLGTAFAVVVDDLDRRKVYPEIVPLERVADVTLDATGNVKGYALEYQIVGRDDRPVVFRREVTGESIRETEGKTVTLDDENPYGFVPAWMVRNRHIGGLFGAPAIDGVIAKIDELNSLVTWVHNYVAKWANQPMVFYGGNEPPATIKAGETDDAGVVAEQEAVRWLHSTTADGKVVPLLQSMDIAQAGIFLTELMEEIENDLPELTIDKELRAMSQVTGPGANQVLGDVRGKLEEMEANYDGGLIRGAQQLVAIGGWRAGRGDWGPRSQLTDQQRKFLGFDLTSYGRGELAMELAPRPLVAPTPMERLTQWQTEKDVLGLSDQEMRRRAGIDQATGDKIDAELVAARETEAARFAAGAAFA